VKLATKEAVAQALGRDLTDEESKRVEHLLTILSAKFCQEARTTFTPVTYTHRVKVNGRHARPQRLPLIAVTSVVDDDAQPVPFTLRHGYVDVDLPSDRFVTMTYQAGYTEVPDVVAAQDDVNAPVGGNDRGHRAPRPPHRAPTPQGTFRVHAPILSHTGSTGCEQNRGRGHATSSGQVSR